MRKKELIEKGVEQYREKIFHHILSMVKDEELAQDLTQETFLKAYNKLDTFREESSFYTWLYRIGHNLTLNFLKKRGKLHEVELKEELMRVPEVALDQEWDESIAQVLDLLSEKHRIVFQLCVLEKRPQKEVAALLGIPEGTVRSRLHTARKEIRRFLEKD